MERDTSSTIDISPIRLVFKNFIVLAAGDGATRLLGLAATVYLARTLGSSDFGKISFVLAIVLAFSALASSGIGTWGTRGVARLNGSSNRLVGNILTLRAALLIVSYGALAALAYVLLEFGDRETGLMLFIFGLELLVLGLSLDWVFEGIQRMGYVSLRRVLRQVLYVGGVFLLVKSADNLVLVPVLYATSGLLSVLIILYLARRKALVPSLSTELTAWRSAFRGSLPITVSAMMILTYHTSDQIMLGIMRGSSDVGLYVAGAKLVVINTFLPLLLMRAFFPSISQLYEQGTKESLRNHMAHYVRGMSFLALPMAVGGILLADEIIGTLYGGAYTSSVLPLRILWIASVVSVFGMIYGQPLLAWDRQKSLMKAVMAAAVLNVVLNSVLIPLYGPAGAAGATVAAELIATTVSYIMIWDVLRHHTLGYSFRPLVACIAMVPIVLLGKLWNFPLVAIIALGGSVYLATSFLIGATPTREFLVNRHLVKE